MAGMTPLQIRPDHKKTGTYESKNSNDLRHTWTQDYSTDGCQVNWLFSLRRPAQSLKKSKYGETVPNFHEVRKKNYATTDEPQEGPYQRLYKRETGEEPTELPEEEQTMEKYYNYNDTKHIIQNRVSMRVSGGNTENMNFMLHLRGGLQNKPDQQWKRYFTKPHKSFDMAKGILADPKYKEQHTTPLEHNKKIERNNNALPMETIRDQPIVFHRWPGCEGAATNTWGPLVKDRKHGHKSRMNIKWETTLREKEGYLENLGSRLSDNRSEGCITEMLGKKRWNFASSHPENKRGCDAKFDPKLFHINNFDMEPFNDPVSQDLRRQKQQPHEGRITERVAKE